MAKRESSAKVANGVPITTGYQPRARGKASVDELQSHSPRVSDSEENRDLGTQAAMQGMGVMGSRISDRVRR